jgi:beta-phosphoglucomutase
MDGVFVNTEPLVFPVFRNAFAPFQINLTDEYQYRFIGKPFSSNLADIRNDYNIEFDTAKLLHEFELFYENVISENLKDVQQGVEKIVYHGKEKGLLFGLCTTSTRNHVNIVFDILQKNRNENVSEWLDALVCGDEVQHRKPHPEPYITTAKKLNVPPTECIAIEDTMTGIEAAKEAGCFAIALQQPYNQHHDFSRADMLVDNLDHVIEILH